MHCLLASTFVTTIVLGSASSCSTERLRRLLREERHRAWACESVHLKVIEDQPWEAWALDSQEAFEQLSFKVIHPHPLKDIEREDVLWSLVSPPYNQTMPDGAKRLPEVATARFWTNMHVPPGRAFAVEQLNRLAPVRAWVPQLFSNLGVAGSVDLYATRVGRKKVGSYGWHLDTVDALIYVLKGAKRVRVAGHYAGSKVTLDKVLSAGSLVYVPGGRFHILHSLPTDVDSKTAELVVVLSIGLFNPNEDLLEVRTETCRSAFENQNLLWSDMAGHTAALPEDFSRKPEVVYADKDALDSKGLGALHRRVLQRDTLRLTMLLHQEAEVNLRSRPMEGRPSLTPLGLAACCVDDEETALLLSAKLLEFGATSPVEFHEDGRSFSAAQVARRRNDAFAAQLQLRIQAASDTGEL